MLIPLSYTPVDHEKLANVLMKYHTRSHQDMITDFELALAKYTGVAKAVALQSGTAAMHLALKALGVSSGDFVIVPTFTYIGSVNPVLYLGAIPVFIDCEPVNWNIDPAMVEAAILDLQKENKKPKAIVVVHTYGMPADMEAIMKISNTYDVPVLEDAAEAIGSTYKGKNAGNLGDIGILSFNNNKTLTTYGGGAVLTSNKEIGEKVLYWATQAREPKSYYYHTEVGYNYRMSALNAAMGLAQWPSLHELVDNRKSIFSRYADKLLPRGFTTQNDADAESNRWLSVFAFPGNCLDHTVKTCFEKFRESEIEVRPFWNPLHTHPLFEGYKVYGGSVAIDLFRRGICLPSSNGIGDSDIALVTNFLEVC